MCRFPSRRGISPASPTPVPQAWTPSSNPFPDNQIRILRRKVFRTMGLSDRHVHSGMQTTALTPALGVEVSGVDDLTDDLVAARCLEALKWRGVLLIRGLDLDDEQQIAFSGKLGEVLAPGGKK